MANKTDNENAKRGWWLLAGTWLGIFCGAIIWRSGIIPSAWGWLVTSTSDNPVVALVLSSALWTTGIIAGLLLLVLVVGVAKGAWDKRTARYEATQADFDERKKIVRARIDRQG